jgi:plastocyanin
MSRQALRRSALLTILAAGLVAGGCGGSSGSSSNASTTATTATSASTATSTSTSTAPAGGGGSQASVQVLKLTANPGGALSYNTTTLHAKPGKVKIEFTNEAPLSHDVTVQSGEGSTLGATPIFTGGTKSVTLEVKAGTYTFFCSVPGHRQGGMQGTLTVG